MSQRRRGRPEGTKRIAEPRSHVSTWIPVTHHDRLSRIAIRHGMSVSKVVKRAILIFLKDDTSGPPQN